MQPLHQSQRLEIEATAPEPAGSTFSGFYRVATALIMKLPLLSFLSTYSTKLLSRR